MKRQNVIVSWSPREVPSWSGFVRGTWGGLKSFVLCVNLGEGRLFIFCAGGEFKGVKQHLESQSCH